MTKNSPTFHFAKPISSISHGKEWHVMVLLPFSRYSGSCLCIPDPCYGSDAKHLWRYTEIVRILKDSRYWQWMIQHFPLLDIKANINNMLSGRSRIIHYAVRICESTCIPLQLVYREAAIWEDCYAFHLDLIILEILWLPVKAVCIKLSCTADNFNREEWIWRNSGNYLEEVRGKCFMHDFRSSKMMSDIRQYS